MIQTWLSFLIQSYYRLYPLNVHVLVYIIYICREIHDEVGSFHVAHFSLNDFCNDVYVDATTHIRKGNVTLRILNIKLNISTKHI